MPSALDILSAVMLQAIDSEEVITQISHGFAVQDCVRHNGSIYVKAQSDNGANAEAVGVVRAVNGNEFTVVYGGRINGLSGLVAGSPYFLSDVTAGLLTTVEPTTAGCVSKPVMVATSNTSAIVINMRGTVLGNSGVVGMTYVHQQSTSSASWSIQHNLNTLDVMIQCYDAASGNLIYPTTVDIVDSNNLIAYFGTASSGKAMVVALLGTSSGYQRGVADVRLDYLSTTTIELKDVSNLSGKIDVNGEIVDCIVHKILAKTDNLITAVGADAGSAMSVSTFYYCYVSNSLATYAPLALRASTTAPTANGYLGASGNAANWRYVGDCYLESDGLFYDSGTKRLVRSEYNILWKSLISYNTNANWTVASGVSSFREGNAGTGQVRGYFLGDGKTNVVINGTGDAAGANTTGAMGIGYDSTTVNAGTYGMISSSATFSHSVAMLAAYVPTKALHYITQLEANYGGSSISVHNDRTLILASVPM